MRREVGELTMIDDQAQEEVLEALLFAISVGHAAAASQRSALPENLMTIVDSFGFVQLVAMLEQRLGIELDLEGVDLGDLVVSTSLISFLQDQVQTQGGVDPVVA